MDQALALAGFFAAHAIWCVSDGDVLIPMLARVDPSGAKSMSRLAADRLEDGVAEGRRQLAEHVGDSACAVLVYDGYVTLASGKTDALLLEIRTYTQASMELSMAVPYRARHSAQGFAVYRPQFLAYEGRERTDHSHVAEAFFRGVDSHTKGAAIWSQAMEPSI